jgi:hypothetical protein
MKKDAAKNNINTQLATAPQESKARVCDMFIPSLIIDPIARADVLLLLSRILYRMFRNPLWHMELGLTTSPVRLKAYWVSIEVLSGQYGMSRLVFLNKLKKLRDFGILAIYTMANKDKKPGCKYGGGKRTFILFNTPKLKSILDIEYLCFQLDDSLKKKANTWAGSNLCLLLSSTKRTSTRNYMMRYAPPVP